MIHIKSVATVLLTMTVLTYYAQAQTYPLRTIEEVQFVLNPEVNDQSFLLGDTIEVRGLVMNDVRAVTSGAGWACFIVDPDLPSDPWQGLFIVQEDSAVSATQFGTVQTGMICRFTGVVQEIETQTQLTLLTDPPVPVVVETAGNLLPLPILLGTNDLSGPQNGEQWEGQLVRIAYAQITDDAYPSNRAIIEDLSGLPTFMDDGFAFFYDMLENGSYSWPQVGSEIDVSGLVRGLSDGYSINPRNFSDLILLSGPPDISNVIRIPGVPASDDSVMVTSTIIDNNGVASASLHYSIDWGPWDVIAMSPSGDEWSATLPEQADGSFLRYFIAAADNDGLESRLPADTSRASGSVFRYVVRDNGLFIADVQNTYGYGKDVSGYNGYTVTLEGVVMSKPAQFPGYYIQDAAAAWSGIFVFNTQEIYDSGDWITVTGRIEEDFGLTKLLISSTDLVTPGFGEFDAVPQQTGDLATFGPLAEAYESVLVSFENVTVTDALPDFPNNFGEFIIDDGSGGLRVDDESELYNGNLLGEITEGSFGFIRGIHFYSFGDFKLAPRDSNDVGLGVVGLNDPADIPAGFDLKQNYPNPFNPLTVIRYRLSVVSDVTLTVYDLLGRKVRTLVAERQAAGVQSAVWDGSDQTGRPVSSGLYMYRMQAGSLAQSRKMLLIR